MVHCDTNLRDVTLVLRGHGGRCEQRLGEDGLAGCRPHDWRDPDGDALVCDAQSSSGYRQHRDHGVYGTVIRS